MSPGALAIRRCPRLGARAAHELMPLLRRAGAGVALKPARTARTVGVTRNRGTPPDALRRLSGGRAVQHARAPAAGETRLLRVVLRTRYLEEDGPLQRHREIPLREPDCATRVVLIWGSPTRCTPPAAPRPRRWRAAVIERMRILGRRRRAAAHGPGGVVERRGAGLLGAAAYVSQHSPPGPPDRCFYT